MKTIFFLCSIFLFGASAASCTWIGEKAGQAHAKIERGTEEMKHGYDKGYQEEQGGSGSQKAEPKDEPKAEPKADQQDEQKSG
jgi:hypothetical protein